MEIMKNEDELSQNFASVLLTEKVKLPKKVSLNSNDVTTKYYKGKMKKSFCNKKEKISRQHGMCMCDPVRPVIINKSKFKKVIEDLHNDFVATQFKHYVFNNCYNGDQDPVKIFNKKVKNLKYIINFCGYYLTTLNVIAYNHSRLMPLINTKCPNIETLILKFKVIDNKDFENVFSNMSHLKQLKLEWDCENLTLPDTLVESLKQVGGTLNDFVLRNETKQNEICLPNSLALVFSQFTDLKELTILNFDVNQSLIDSIGQIKNLEDLKFSWANNPNFQIKEYNMYPIGNLKNIEYLYIDWINGVTDEFLINLSNNSKNLKHLTITGTYITDNGVIAVNNLNELQDLKFNPYSSSKNENKFITDKSIQCLTNENLGILGLSNCTGITNNSMLKLVENLKNLYALIIENTKVTADVVEEMKKLKNNLFILHHIFENNNNV